MKQFIKFGIVGISNTVISYVLYLMFLKVFEGFQIFNGYDYFICSLISFVLSVLWSFYWNNRFTFKLEENESRSGAKSLVKTYISYSLTGVVLHNILLYMWVEHMGISKELAPIINLLITIPLNFVMNKLWAFKSVRT